MNKTLSLEVKRFSRSLLSAIGTPHAVAAQAMIQREDWVGIANLRTDPKAYNNAAEYFLDAQASSLLRKLQDLPTPARARRAKALENWRKGEVDCYRTNERLTPYLEGMTHPDCDPAILQHLVGVRKIVKSILGKAPAMDDLAPKFGPGATFSDPSVRSTIADKMNSASSLTLGAKWFILPWMQTKWGDLTVRNTTPRSPEWVRGNRFATAPKDATKDRPIGAEPSLNVFYQLGLGQALRSRLKRAGIDLDNGQEKHRRVACASSITGSHATLDLSNASDTVAYNLVKLLLPPDWFEHLNELRSPATRFTRADLSLMAGRAWVDSKSKNWAKLEKFSSMGNGFTFELESLIFYALVKYIEMMYLPDHIEPMTLVYGDDIICNTEIVPAVIPFLTFCGFRLNEEKSFWDGPFRESCGGDYFSGEAVRPYFMKETPCEPQHFIAAANAVRTAFENSPVGFDRARSSWFNLLDNIPSEVRRCRGPQGLGDIVIHDDESRWLTRQRSQTKYIQCYRPVRTQKVPFRLFDADVVLACALYGVPSGGKNGGLIPRHPVQGHKVGWVVAYGNHWLPEVRDPRPEEKEPPAWESQFCGPPFKHPVRIKMPKQTAL